MMFYLNDLNPDNTPSPKKTTPHRIEVNNYYLSKEDNLNFAHGGAFAYF
jgi:hypothetical protein